MTNTPKIQMPDGFDHQAFQSIDSTNKEAIRQTEQGVGSGRWITASEQSGGRGRRGREWVSKHGNLYCSLIYDTEKDVYQSSQLSFVAALAVRDTISEFVTDREVKCKWPNDIQVMGQKISGILLESVSDGSGSLKYMVIGIGINITHHPDLQNYQATHINENSENDFSHIDVFFVLTQKMAYWLEVWKKYGFAEIKNYWKKSCIGLGEQIIVNLPQGEINGCFVDLDDDGALLLEINNDDGTKETKTIHSGDIFFGAG